MRNPGKGRLLTFEPSSGNWRKNLGTDIRNGSVKRYPIIGIPFGLRPHSIPIMGNDTVNGILPYFSVSEPFLHSRKLLSHSNKTWRQIIEEVMSRKLRMEPFSMRNIYNAAISIKTAAINKDLPHFIILSVLHGVI